MKSITSMPVVEEGNKEKPSRVTGQYSGEGQRLDTNSSMSAHENTNYQDDNGSEKSPTTRVLAKIQRYDTASNRWKRASTLRQQEKKGPIEIHLRRGGTVKVFPNVLAKETPRQVRGQELFDSGMFRQYQNQSVDEPRCHMLLHEDATDCFEDKQPGYHYNNTTLKSRPLKRFQELQNLSKEMAALCNVNKWTIGVNPVLYRDGKDRMGDHADDSQEEALILAVLVDSPTEARRVVVRPFSKLDLQDGDEKIELFMEPGDAYSMDGRMQESYSHCVPPAKRHVGEGNRRLAIVFRTGKEIWFPNDSGQPCPNLAPRQKSTLLLGNGDLGLIEGKCYTRMVMYRTRAHRMLQRGVSGNREDGCDAIVVSGKRADRLGEDHFERLYYVADFKTGALALLTSYKKSLCIRVFRSSAYLNVYRAPKQKAGEPTVYRYDGLYCIQSVIQPPERKQPYTFVFERLNPPFNEFHCREYRHHCESQQTLLAPNHRESRLLWDGSRMPEQKLDGEALYSHCVTEKPVRFRPSPCGELVNTVLQFGMKQLRLLMESNHKDQGPPTVCSDSDGRHIISGNVPLQVPLELRRWPAAPPIVPKTRKMSRYARRLPPGGVGVKELPRKKKSKKPNGHQSHQCLTSGSTEQLASMKPRWHLQSVAPRLPGAKTQTAPAGIGDPQEEKSGLVVVTAAPAGVGRRGIVEDPSPGGLLRSLLKLAAANKIRWGWRQRLQKGHVQTITVWLIGVKIPAVTLIATGIGVGKCGSVVRNPTVAPVPFIGTNKDVVRFSKGSWGIPTPISANVSGKDGTEAKHPVKAASETDTD